MDSKPYTSVISSGADTGLMTKASGLNDVPMQDITSLVTLWNGDWGLDLLSVDDWSFSKYLWKIIVIDFEFLKQKIVLHISSCTLQPTNL